MQKDLIPYSISLYDGKRYIGTVWTNISEIDEVMEQISCEYMGFNPFKNWNKKEKKCTK